MRGRIRHSAAFCLLLFLALLANAVRLQVLQADTLDHNPANRRTAVARYAHPRGVIVAGGRPVTGSRDTRERLRYERTYADGPLYAPVTGYDSQTYGMSLIESAEDGILSGKDPALARLPLLNGVPGHRQPGGRVVTTIEPAAQRAAFDALAGRRGAVAAIEPSTGRILALVSSPSYDPGALSGTGSAVEYAWRTLGDDSAQPMLDRAIHQTYPPGSAFKLVTAAAALDAGVVRDIDAPSGVHSPYLLPGTRTLLPDEGEGCDDASLQYAIARSCNTVMAGLGVRTGLARMVRTAERFGFNDAGLRIPVAVARSTFDRGMSGDQLALSSIGQFDTAATPLQMAMVAAAVANGGTLARPRLVDRTTTADGRLVARTPVRSYARVMAAGTARLLRRMMVAAVQEGTGTNAALPGAEVGGKTGTAQHGPGNTGTPYAWFVSWARGYDTPRPAVAVAVVVEDAEANRADISGGGDAAPVARAVMSAALGEDRMRDGG